MLIRRKIAGSALRRLKTKRKLRPLRSRKNAARKYSSKSGLNFREMMGGMKGNVTYLVYYGSPKIHNPSVRLLHTFVGILFCDGNDWILCVSNELADKYKHVRYVRMKKRGIAPHNQESMDKQSEKLKEQYAAIDKIIDDLLDDGIHEPISETELTHPGIIARYKDAAADHIVCQFIKRLCNLNKTQEETLKAYLEDPEHNELFHTRTSSGFECEFNWFFTFNKNLFSSGGDLSAYLNGKKVKVLEKVVPIANPQLEGLISKLPTAPASTTSSTSSPEVVTSSTSSPEVVDRNFLLVVPKIKSEYPSSNFASIQDEASHLLELEYKTLGSGSYINQQKFNKIIGRSMPIDGALYFPRDTEVLDYLKEISR